MSRLITALLAGLVLVGLIGLPCPAPAQETPAVTLYEHAGFQGQQMTYTGNERNLPNWGISSIRLHGGAVVTVFQKKDYQGRVATLISDTDDMGYTRVGNDNIQSFMLFTSGHYLILYEEADFGGVSQVFENDVSSLEGTHLGDDQASSVRLIDCQATLYQLVNYGGVSETFSRDAPDLRLSHVGNDKVSSLKVLPNKVEPAAKPVEQPAPRPSDFNLARGKPVWGRGLSGVPSALTDGQTFPPGTDVRVQPSTQLQDEKSFATIDLGEVKSVVRVKVQADADDEYLVFLSEDGTVWPIILPVPKVPGHGFETRVLSVETKARYVKIMGSKRFGTFSVAEVEVHGN